MEHLIALLSFYVYSNLATTPYFCYLGLCGWDICLKNISLVQLNNPQEAPNLNSFKLMLNQLLLNKLEAVGPILSVTNGPNVFSWPSEIQIVYTNKSIILR